MNSNDLRGSSRSTAAALERAPAFGFRAARWLLFATVLVPVVIDPKAWFPFVTTRAVFFRVLMELATACLLFLALRHEARPSFRRDPVFLALLSFTAAMAVATLFSAAPWKSLYGDYTRMGGLWAWFHLFVFYVALRTFFSEADWRRYFRAAVGVALAVCVYGFIQYYNDLLRLPWEGTPRAAIHATAGNSGLLAIYLGLSFGLLVYLAVSTSPRRRTPYVLAGLVIMYAIFLAQNRSTLLGAIAGVGAALLTYALFPTPRRRIALGAGAALVGAGLLLPVLATQPEVRGVVSRVPLGARLSAGVDRARVLQWQAAVNGIRERPLLGYGPENYHLVWTRFGEPEMLQYLDDQSLWDRAHNVYLDVFATTGVFGFLTFLAVWGSILWSILAGARAGKFSPLEGAALAGLVVWYAVYLFFWFFDLASTMLWLAVAAYVASRATGAPLVTFGARLALRPQTVVVLAGGAFALAATLYVHGYETLRLTRILHRIDTARQPSLDMLRDFSDAFASRAPDTHHAFLLYSDYLRRLLPHYNEIRRDPVLSAALDTAFTRAFVAVEIESRRDPLNERMAAQKARIALLAWGYYGNPRFREVGVESLREAVKLAPRRVGVRLSLASALESGGESDAALAQLRYALALHPSYAPTLRALTRLHVNAGDFEAADFWLRKSFTHGHFGDRTQIVRVAEALVHGGRWAAADSLLCAYFLNKYGPLVLWPEALGDSLTLKDESRLGEIWRDAARAVGNRQRAANIERALERWRAASRLRGLESAGRWTATRDTSEN